MHQDKVSGSLLLALGIFTIGTGLYFVFVRPSLLPEDVVFTGIDPNVLPPQFLKWIGIVFATWGGSTTGFGLTLSGLGAALFSGSYRWLRWGAALGILVAFGRFLASNVMIESDFLWFIALLFLFALAAIASLFLRRTPTETQR
jgi:hypothetical protein